MLEKIIDALIDEKDTYVFDPSWKGEEIGGVGYRIENPKLHKFSLGYLVTGLGTVDLGKYVSVHDLYKREVFDYCCRSTGIISLVIYTNRVYEDRAYYDIPTDFTHEEFFEHSLINDIHISYDLYLKIITYCKSI